MVSFHSTPPHPRSIDYVYMFTGWTVAGVLRNTCGKGSADVIKKLRSCTLFANGSTKVKCLILGLRGKRIEHWSTILDFDSNGVILCTLRYFPCSSLKEFSTRKDCRKLNSMSWWVNTLHNFCDLLFERIISELIDQHIAVILPLFFVDISCAIFWTLKPRPKLNNQKNLIQFRNSKISTYNVSPWLNYHFFVPISPRDSIQWLQFWVEISFEDPPLTNRQVDGSGFDKV